MVVPGSLKKKMAWLFRRAEGALLADDILATLGAHLDPDGAWLALVAMEDDVAIAGETARLAALRRARGAGGASALGLAYRDRYGLAGVRRFEANVAGDGTATIFELAIETFPRHVNNVHLVVSARGRLLFDCGSGIRSSERDLALGFAIVRGAFGVDVAIDGIDTCLVSHGHIDHFGGLNRFRQASRATVAIHALDAPTVTAFEARLASAAERLSSFWESAGVPAAERESLRSLYTASKAIFRADTVDRTVEDGDVVGGFRVHHVPGHCPGLLCLEVGDVLLTSDHVLARITPHQFPASIMPFGGLDQYFASLAKIRRLPGIRFALGGHEEPIDDLGARIDAIEAFHRRRLDRVEEICHAPRSVVAIANELFPPQEGYGTILALDEAGAHVEALAAAGRVREVRGESVIQYVAR